MPEEKDEFGGVAVAEPQTDEFGGTLVEEGAAPVPPPPGIIPPDQQFKLSPYQKLRMSPEYLVAVPAGGAMGPYGPIDPSESVRSLSQIPATLVAAPGVAGRALTSAANWVARGFREMTETKPAPIFGESEEEYKKREQYPLGAPGEELYIPQTGDPSDVQKWAAQASTLDQLLTLPLGATRIGGKILLASMLPGIVQQIKDIGAGPGDATDKLERAKNLVIPAAIGLLATRPKGGRILPERLGPEADIGTPVYPPLELTGGEALINRPQGFVPIRARAAEPVGPPVPRRGLPIDVPETPGAVQEDVIAEIRRRGAHTRQEIAN